MPLDTKQLQQLSTVISEGTYMRAADMLNMSQPSISKNIQLLERSVGAKLLERGRRGAEATVFGRALALRYRRIEAELQQAALDIQELKGVIKGHLKIGATRTAASYIAPLALAKFKDMRPKVVVELTEDRSDRLLEFLEKGEFDLVIGPVYGEVLDPEIQEEFLFNSVLVVVVRPGHPLANRKSVKASDLAPYPFIGVRVSSTPSRQVELLLKASGLQAFPYLLATNSVDTAKRIIERSDHFAVMPKSQVAADSSALHMIELDAPGNSWPIGARWLRYRGANPALQAFLEALRREAEMLDVESGQPE